MLRPVDDQQPDEDACPLGVCDGTGWIFDEAGDAVRCECSERRIRASAGRRMGTGVPKRYRGVSFDRRPIADLDPSVIRPVRQYVRDIDDNLDRGRGLWFFGDVGTGKTSLAMLVSKAAQEAGRSVAIYSMPRLLADIRDTYDRDSGGAPYSAFFRRLCSVDLLHLDDLGAEHRTDWVLEQVYSIVNERWQDQRAMLVTTNVVDLNDLREQIGTRTVSRLSEMCDAHPVFGADLRMMAGD
jgi:DNA replication protein DnaC